METKTRLIARAVKLINNRGTVIFNDALVDGTRSLKVWGWAADDYALAANLLTQAGCKVNRVVTRKGRTRLHVKE